MTHTTVGPPFPRRGVIPVAGIILVMLTLTCGASTQVLERRLRAPDFVLEDMSGNQHRLSTLHGKVVLLNFWATWCAPCRAEFPSLERIWRLMRDQDLVVLAVTTDDQQENVHSFLRSLSPTPTFPVLIDEGARYSQYWPVRGIPSSFLVDKSGNVAAIIHGAVRWTRPDFLKMIGTLLREAGPLTRDDISS